MKLSFNRKTKIVIVLLLLVAIALLIWWWLGRGGVLDNRYDINSQAKTGINTGYHLEIELDRLPLNPYPGSEVGGRVWVADEKNRPVRDVEGGVWLRVASARTGIHSRYLGREAILIGDRLVDPFVANYGLEGPQPGQWKVAEDGSNQYSFAPTDRSNLPNATYAYLQLENGSADFTYINIVQDTLMDERDIVISASTIEQPLYAPAQSQYLEDRRVNRNLDGTINTGEPTSVRQQREKDVKGYQLIPVERLLQLQTDPNLLPSNQAEADQATERTTLIETSLTVPFGKFADIAMPDAPRIIESAEDYYYELSFAPARLTQPNQKFTATVRPVAKPGKQLPADMGNIIELVIGQHYPTVANDYPAQFTAANRTALQDNFLRFETSRPAGAPSPFNDTIVFVAGANPIQLEVELTGRENLFGFISFDAKVFDQAAYEELQRVHNGRAPQAEIEKLKTMRLVFGQPAPIVERDTSSQ